MTRVKSPEQKAAQATRDRERSKRLRQVRGASIAVGRLSQRELRAGRVAFPEAKVRHLPMTRGECINGVRPCPHVSCAHHLYLDVNNATGSIKLNFPDLEPHEMETSCVLDVALGAGDPSTGQGTGATGDVVAKIFNLTIARISQIEAKAIAKLEGLRGRVLRDFVDVQPAVVRPRAAAPVDDDDVDDEQAEAAE